MIIVFGYSQFLFSMSKLINIHVQRVKILRIGGIKNLGMKTTLAAMFQVQRISEQPQILGLGPLKWKKPVPNKKHFTFT